MITLTEHQLDHFLVFNLCMLFLVEVVSVVTSDERLFRRLWMTSLSGGVMVHVQACGHASIALAASPGQPQDEFWEIEIGRLTDDKSSINQGVAGNSVVRI